MPIKRERLEEPTPEQREREAVAEVMDVLGRADLGALIAAEKRAILARDIIARLHHRCFFGKPE